MRIITFSLFILISQYPFSFLLGEEAIPWQIRDLPAETKNHSKVISSKSEHYEIIMGGQVDLDSAITRKHHGLEVAWQPQEFIEISNVGQEVCKNPKIVVNGQRDWSTPQNLLTEVLRGARSDQEKVYLLWKFMWENTHHDAPLFEFNDANGDDLHDPIRFLNSYGGGLCDDRGSVMAALASMAGIGYRQHALRALNGHMMSEIYASDRWQLIDVDLGVFYLDRENQYPVSGAVLAKDHDLVTRELHYGAFEEGFRRTGAVYGPDDVRTFRDVTRSNIEFNLRPGESIQYRWDNKGKYPSDGMSRKRMFLGNSRMSYDLLRTDLNKYGIKTIDVRHVLLDKKQPLILASSGNTRFMVDVKTPYVLAGGECELSMFNPNENIRISLFTGSHQDKMYKFWETTNKGTYQHRFELDTFITGVHKKPMYNYVFIFKMEPLQKHAPYQPVVISNLKLHSELLVSPLALPRLKLGKNQVHYTDDSGGQRKAMVTFRWKETNAAKPAAKVKLIEPAPDSVVHKSKINYRWQKDEGTDAWQIMVSRDPQLRWPYRPSLDMVLNTTSIELPYPGAYSPGEIYYWKVRARTALGIWGPWSEVREFQWEGPKVPVKLKVKQKGVYPKLVLNLVWEANPKGKRPVKYRIYGSDIRGFSIQDHEHEVRVLGKMPANFYTETTKTEVPILFYGIEKPPHPNMNRSYYRVVAIDEDGVWSGSSDYFELYHPSIYTVPKKTEFRVGEIFNYQVRATRSLGDLQRRGPRDDYYDKEIIRFKLMNNPSWLSINAETGLISGTPSEKDVGKVKITVRAMAGYEVKMHNKKRIPTRASKFQDQHIELNVLPVAQKESK